MTNLFALCLCVAISEPGLPEPGTQLVVKGYLEAKQLGSNSPRKDFQLSVMVEEASKDMISVVWTVEERGAGGWSWADHFGRARVAADGTITGTTPSLQFEREDGDHPMNLLLPINRFGEPLNVDMQWTEGKNVSEVTEQTTYKEQPCWRIVVRTPIGVKREYLVARELPTIVQLSETVFVGQGEEHRLRYELATQRTLTAAEFTAVRTGFDRISNLRTQMRVEPRVVRKDWSDEQLSALRGSLDDLEQLKELGFLRQLITEVELDAKQQKNRAGAVAFLQGKILGTPTPDFELVDVDGNSVKSATFGGKVTVLHFWDYRDSPLREPYGQSAYLDFLARRRASKSSSVRVFGIAVDARLDEPDNRSKAIQSVRKFQSFMNISYPILLDSGSLIKKFGDPRTAGTRLPLFVVLDQQRNVVHYHAGDYDIKPNQGLVELDGVIQQALGIAK